MNDHKPIKNDCLHYFLNFYNELHGWKEIDGYAMDIGAKCEEDPIL